MFVLNETANMNEQNMFACLNNLKGTVKTNITFYFCGIKPENPIWSFWLPFMYYNELDIYFNGVSFLKTRRYHSLEELDEMSPQYNNYVLFQKHVVNIKQILYYRMKETMQILQINFNDSFKSKPKSRAIFDEHTELLNNYQQLKFVIDELLLTNKDEIEYL